MRGRAISIADLNKLRLWVEIKPDVPEGSWYKDNGSFKIRSCSESAKTFLLGGRGAVFHRTDCAGDGVLLDSGVARFFLRKSAKHFPRGGLISIWTLEIL